MPTAAALHHIDNLVVVIPGKVSRFHNLLHVPVYISRLGRFPSARRAAAGLSSGLLLAPFWRLPRDAENPALNLRDRGFRGRQVWGHRLMQAAIQCGLREPSGTL